MLQKIELTYRANKSNYTDDFRLRIHRAISWLKKAENTEDPDIKFSTLWIAFNAAYAREIVNESAIEKETFIDFITNICCLDNNKQLESIIWNELPDPISALLENRYTFQPFWFELRKEFPSNRWERKMQEANNLALNSIRMKNTRGVLVFTFERLYTLRNQIFHGGSTYNSSANRTQLQDGCDILSKIVPIIIQIMIDNPSTVDWGKPFYPYIMQDNK